MTDGKLQLVRSRREREDTVENYLSGKVKAMSGLCLKLLPDVLKGLPDRLVLLPGGRVMFVETKRPVGGKISELQKTWINRLRRLGFAAVVACTKNAVDEALTSLQSRVI